MEPKTQEALKLGAKTFVSPLITAFGGAAGAVGGWAGTVVAPIGALAAFGTAAIDVIKGDFENAADMGLLGGLCTAFTAASYGAGILLQNIDKYWHYPQGSVAVGAAVGAAAALGYSGYKVYEQYQRYKDPEEAQRQDAIKAAQKLTEEEHVHDEPHGEKQDRLADVVVIRDKFNCHSCGSTEPPVKVKNDAGGFDASCRSCGSDAGSAFMLNLKAA